MANHFAAVLEPEIVRYGKMDPQYIELWAPEIETPKGYAILIHGGYWRAMWDATLMHPLVRDLLARGWAVANIEYRSVGNGGGWPLTLDDVRSAIQCAKDARPQWCANCPVVNVGHSVGGQLALLVADLADAVVGLAPVTDVRRVDAEELDDNAASGFMGGHYADLSDAYDLASPIRQIPLKRPILVVHGDVDVWVPVEHSEDFVKAALAAGDLVDFQKIPGLDHMAAIDPAAAHWRHTVQWMQQR
ncbi:alpha/beta hydrolase family protein [Arthrobacter antibioticus]|uniref:alpha/beta hydrolase family protein n=1 Tax=Arthrobacter sp. H35-MC1 TaxID=3046203 RepID=UPI0024BB106B|nr:alpha/beta hydrolase [Arthrobacter sp. H35-MC1]MDJ0316067.1 alpha/beta hydrolase [Arthrobacter sp. H35-MC1]